MGLKDAILGAIIPPPATVAKKFNVFLGKFVGDSGDAWQSLLKKRLETLERVAVHTMVRDFDAGGSTATSNPMQMGRNGLKALQNCGGQLMIFGQVGSANKPSSLSIFMQRVGMTREENAEYFIAPHRVTFDEATRDRVANVLTALVAVECCQEYNMKGNLLNAAIAALKRVESGVTNAFYTGGEPEQQAFLGTLYAYVLRHAPQVLDIGEMPIEPMLNTIRTWADNNVERISPLGASRLYNQLGQAYRVHAAKLRDLSLMNVVVELYQKALGTCSREESITDWVVAKNNLGIAYRVMGDWGKDPQYLQLALNEYLAVLGQKELRDLPLIWATTLSNSGNAYLLLGRQTESLGPLVKALAAYKEASVLYTKLGQSLDLAISTNNTANATEMIALQKRSRNDMQDALDLYTQAKRTFSPSSTYFAEVQRNIERCQDHLSRMPNPNAQR